MASSPRRKICAAADAQRLLDARKSIFCSDLRLLEQACKDCDPENEPDLLFGLGSTYMQMKKSTEARRVFEEIIVRFPDTNQAQRARNNLDQIK